MTDAQEPQKPLVGDAEGDRFMKGLGVTRLAIPIPFTAAGGPVNVYLVDNEDGSLTLFDAGLGTDEARAHLVRGFAEAGRRLEEVTRIVVSHGHIDHYGAARFVVGRSGAKVFVHPADRDKIVTSSRWVERLPLYRDYFVNAGVPADRVEKMASIAGSTERFAERLDDVEELAEGMTFRFKHFEAKVLHLPGHTPGLVCLHDEAHRVLFADDHVLAKVSPNPLLELTHEDEAKKFRSLSSYFRSAKRVHALDLDWCLPGHGAPFGGHRQVLDSLFGFYEKRQAKLVAGMSEAPKTPYELVSVIFREARTLDLYLMMSEVIGNLEVLEEQGRVRRLPGSPWRYEAVAAS